MTLLDAARGPARRLREASGPIELVACQSVDGLAAAAVLARALGRARRAFHVRFVLPHAPQYDPDVAEGGETSLRLLLDLDAEFAPRLAHLPGETLLVGTSFASTTTSSGGQLLVTPQLAAETESATTASTAALALAIALDEPNWDLAPVALVPAASDSWTGWNAYVAQEAKRRAFIDDAIDLALPDVALLDLLARPPTWLRDLWPPTYRGAATFLQAHGLPADATPHELDARGRQTLASAIAIAHLSARRPPQDLAQLFAPRARPVRAGALPLVRLRSLIEAAAAENEPGLALAYLLGDTTVGPELETIETRLRAHVRRTVQPLDDAPSQEAAMLRSIEVDEAPYARVILRQLDRLSIPDKVFLVHAAVGADAYVAARIPVALARRGLDLSQAMSDAAQAVGGRTAGHRHQVSAWVARDHLSAFLSQLDERLQSQVGAAP